LDASCSPPYLLVVGDREMDTETLAVRTRTGQDLGSMNLPAFVERLQADIARRGRTE
jgi:threonyl-tRNA synthetase